MTAWWQVMGRKEVPWDERMQMDLRYVELVADLDLVIMVKTIQGGGDWPWGAQTSDLAVAVRPSWIHHFSTGSATSRPAAVSAGPAVLLRN